MITRKPDDLTGDVIRICCHVSSHLPAPEQGDVLLTVPAACAVQFTYFQQAGGRPLSIPAVEITYGLERILMSLQVSFL